MMKNLNKEIEESLKGNEFTNLSLDLTEIAIDQFLKEGILKDIPIINSVTSLIKGGINIRDALTIKKLVLFLSKIQEVSSEKREIFFNEISKISKEKNRLFEKLLLTIDKLDDSEKALLLGKVFKH